MPAENSPLSLAAFLSTAFNGTHLWTHNMVKSTFYMNETENGYDVQHCLLY